MEDPEVADQPVVIELRCFASNAGEASRAIESLSRIVLGLTLDGLNVMMQTSLIEFEECDHDHHDHSDLE